MSGWRVWWPGGGGDGGGQALPNVKVAAWDGRKCMRRVTSHRQTLPSRLADVYRDKCLINIYLLCARPLKSLRIE